MIRIFQRPSSSSAFIVLADLARTIQNISPIEASRRYSIPPPYDSANYWGDTDSWQRGSRCTKMSRSQLRNLRRMREWNTWAFQGTAITANTQDSLSTILREMSRLIVTWFMIDCVEMLSKRINCPWGYCMKLSMWVFVLFVVSIWSLLTFPPDNYLLSSPWFFSLSGESIHWLNASSAMSSLSESLDSSLTDDDGASIVYRKMHQLNNMGKLSRFHFSDHKKSPSTMVEDCEKCTKVSLGRYELYMVWSCLQILRMVAWRWLSIICTVL